MNAVPFVVRVWAAGSMTRWVASYAVAGGPDAMATLIAQFDPFQGAPCVRLPAVGALCELADLGFPILAEDMCWRNRASVGDLTRELRGSFAHTDCPSCTREWMCPECEGVERKALRAARRAYALTA